MDPNRVLDLVLDAYVLNPDNLNYQKILSQFKASSIPQILGFKFGIYDASGADNTKETETPPNLFKVTANLIKYQIIKITDIWPHLSPTDANIETHFQELTHAALQMFRTNYVKSLKDKEQKEQKKQEKKELEEKERQEVICKTLL